jgi:hypothetical protein
MPTQLIAGCALLLAFWWMLMRTSKQLRTELRTELDRLSDTIRKLEEKSSRQTSGNGDLTKIANISIIPEKSIAQSLPGSNHQPAQISPETKAAIQATLCAFLGQKIRIRSVKLLQDDTPVATWVTQGRIAIQTSHSQPVSRV